MCPAMEGCKMSPLSTSSNLNINMEKNEIMIPYLSEKNNQINFIKYLIGRCIK